MRSRRSPPKPSRIASAPWSCSRQSDLSSCPPVSDGVPFGQQCRFRTLETFSLDKCCLVDFVRRMADPGGGHCRNPGRSGGGTDHRTEINRRLDVFLQEYGMLTMDWDADTARTWARLRHSPAVKRQPRSLWNSLIDAMAIRHGMKIASRNHVDFRYSVVFDPWTGEEHQPRG